MILIIITIGIAVKTVHIVYFVNYSQQQTTEKIGLSETTRKKGSQWMTAVTKWPLFYANRTVRLSYVNQMKWV